MQTPGSLPPLVVGSPGVGKSSVIVQLAKFLREPLEVVIASLREPSDFGGLPVPGPDGVAMEPPSWARRLAAAGHGILFLDEISCAPPAVQAALLRVVLDRVVGDLALPPGVRIVAAANPVEEAAGGWDLAPALANRFVWVRWETPDAEAWSNWLMGETNISGLVTVDPENWAREWGTARALTAAFIRHRPGLLAEDPAKVAGRGASSAFASPRTWECAARLVATARAVGDDSLVFPLVSGAVGEPAALEFAAWLRDADLPDPEELLADPAKFRADPARPDRVFAILSSVAAAAVREGPTKKEREERWARAWHVIDRAADHGKDMAIVAARTLARNRPSDGLLRNDVRPVIRKLKDVVVAAGLMEDEPPAVLAEAGRK